jgi:glycosyltransferase involved in cell wall biosynthesis
MSSEPFISIITSSYNAVHAIERCLLSVHNQTCQNIEHLIVDGGSSDGTIQIIQKYADLKNSKISWWISEQDSGIYHAWNKALLHVRGEWIYFLGADDYLYSSDTLEIVQDYLKKSYPPYSVVYGKVAIFSIHDQKHVRWIGEPWSEIKEFFLLLNTDLPHQGLFQHRETITMYGFFDERYRIAGDYDMLLRVLKNHEPLFINIPVACMQTGGVSSQSSSEVKLRKEIIRIRRKNGLIDCTSYILFSIVLFFWGGMYKVSPQFTSAMRNTIRKITGKGPN